MSEHKILDRVNSPLDLKTLTLDEMNELAAEIRQMIIDVVSKNGGHLAPNLGAVELTIALHRVFDSPRDKLIFDVGHQAYIHKILTGRKKEFPTLRQYKGLSGFPKRQESEHDIFGVGHSSTSVSAADGIAAVFELVKDINVNVLSSDSTQLVEYAANLFDELTGVLGLVYNRKVKSSLDDEIEKLIELRTQARKDKNWAEADRIRDELKAQGIVLEDTPQGVKWHKE